MQNLFKVCYSSLNGVKFSMLVLLYTKEPLLCLSILTSESYSTDINNKSVQLYKYNHTEILEYSYSND